jgi:hypothetical protein
MSDTKRSLQAVKQYLESNFPGHEVSEDFDFDRGAHVFKVARNPGHYLAKISDEFLADTESQQLGDWLVQARFAEELRRTGDDVLWVSGDGKLKTLART